MLLSSLHGLFPIVGHDDELRWPIVAMAAKCDDVCLGHSRRKIAGKTGDNKRADYWPQETRTPGALIKSQVQRGPEPKYCQESPTISSLLAFSFEHRCPETLISSRISGAPSVKMKSVEA